MTRRDGPRKLLGPKYGVRATTAAGPYVEAVAAAVRGNQQPTRDDLVAALGMLSAYQGEVDTAQRRLITAARAHDESGQPGLTWQEIGLALGYPAGSAKQRAWRLAGQLGVTDDATTEPKGTPA